jgi:hypothetical protein
MKDINTVSRSNPTGIGINTISSTRRISEDPGRNPEKQEIQVLEG